MPGQRVEKVPHAVINDRQDIQTRAVEHFPPTVTEASPAKQILFGDFPAHTTFSNDAYMVSLPLIGGLVAAPPADACDFARYCSALDSRSINDHAVSLDPQRWTDTKTSIRDCQAVDDDANPDLISFIGFEWTQANPLDAATHYGHKNVIYRDLDDNAVGSRPIYAKTDTGLGSLNPPYSARAVLPLARWSDHQAYYDLNLFLKEMEGRVECPADVSTLELPQSCREGAENPAVLFRKLREAGHETLVIPHGNAWGLYTPVGSNWDKQLEGDMQDDQLQTMIEVFSGHGNSEEYRSFSTLLTMRRASQCARLSGRIFYRVVFKWETSSRSAALRLGTLNRSVMSGHLLHNNWRWKPLCPCTQSRDLI